MGALAGLGEKLRKSEIFAGQNFRRSSFFQKWGSSKILAGQNREILGHFWGKNGTPGRPKTTRSGGQPGWGRLIFAVLGQPLEVAGRARGGLKPSSRR